MQEEQEMLSQAGVADEFDDRWQISTSDGRKLTITGMITSAEDVNEFAEVDAGGAMLVSDFLLDKKRASPGEEEQVLEYQALADKAGEKPLTVCTLDNNSDGGFSYLELPEQKNPALGLVGVRIWKRFPPLMDVQLRSLLQVKSSGKLRILVPMISEVGELAWVRQRLEYLANELKLTELPLLGAMIETPAAAICADSIALEADFLCIDSNDLACYCLAADRQQAELGVDALHPAVLRFILATLAGTAGTRPVGLTGSVLSDPVNAGLLLALGLNELLVPLAEVARLKNFLSRFNCNSLADELPELLAKPDAKAVRKFLKDWQEKQASN